LAPLVAPLTFINNLSNYTLGADGIDKSKVIQLKMRLAYSTAKYCYFNID